MTHDYNLPAEWAAMTPAERDRWFKGERARRQALRQDTTAARRLSQAQQRLDRRAAARPETVDLSDYR